MTLYPIVLLFIIALLLFILLYREQKQRKMLRQIECMIQSAAAGNLSETSFDESILSKLETKFYQYLKGVALSEKRIQIEKDKIKELISDLSHQTKTPIANLKLYAELLKEENLSSSVAENVDAIHMQAEKLAFLVSHLIKLSRLESGIIKPVPETRTITDVLSLLDSQFRLIAEKKGLEFDIKAKDCLAIYDLKWTGEAIGNIVDNAIKYTDNGGIRLSIIPYELFIRIDIRDTGIGIRSEEREKIFSRFYRSKEVQEKSGLGIGLYLSREIISRQGGYIKVSAAEVGSIFSVFLPAVQILQK